MGRWYVIFVFEIVLVHATARNVPTTNDEPTDHSIVINHEETNTVNVPKGTAAGKKGVKDKKCGFVYSDIDGIGGIGDFIPFGLGGVGGVGGVGGARGIGGIGRLGCIAGGAACAGDGVGGIGGILP